MIRLLGMIQATIDHRLLFHDPNLGDEPSRSNSAEHGVELAFDRNVDSMGPSAALAHLVALAVNMAITWNIERPIAALLRINADLLDSFCVHSDRHHSNQA